MPTFLQRMIGAAAAKVLRKKIHSGHVEMVPVRDLDNGVTLCMPSYMLGAWQQVPLEARERMINQMQETINQLQRRDDTE